MVDKNPFMPHGMWDHSPAQLKKLSSCEGHWSDENRKSMQWQIDNPEGWYQYRRNCCPSFGEPNPNFKEDKLK